MTLKIERLLLYSFIFLGPLGSLLTPHIFPHSFRAYYFLLPCFPLFFLFIQERLVKLASIFIPCLLYCFLSVAYVEAYGEPNEPFPLFRFFLLVCHFFFIFGSASAIKNKTETSKIIKLYLNSYLITLIVGYIFFAGFYLNLVSFHFIERFSVLAQFGYGLLRFSPGSYPNEYGIVSSYVLSILTLIFLEAKKSPVFYSKKQLNIYFALTFFALLFTTTRAAYMAYFFSLIYLAWITRKFSLVFFRFTTLMSTFLLALYISGINMFNVLIEGFTQKYNEGSLGDRYFTWKQVFERVQEHPFLGMGFATITDTHNVYLQLFFELGIIGSSILLGTIFIFSIESVFKNRRRCDKNDQNQIFFKRIRNLGLIHVIWFAASNHNLNHHLTWFICLLCVVCLRYPRLKEESLLKPLYNN